LYPIVSDTTAKHTVDRAGLSENSAMSSGIMENYDRLLRNHIAQLRKDEFNPYQPFTLLLINPNFKLGFCKEAGRYLKTRNSFRLDLRGGARVLQELDEFNDQTLHGVSECSRINVRRVLGRRVLGRLPKPTAIFASLLAILKAIDTSLPAAVDSSLGSVVVGLLLGSILSLILSLPAIGIVRALDDLITIAVAQRGTRKPG
jgi:hypothetical protein